jgi:hypothetical protein
MGTDNCICKQEYKGTECQNPVCFGLESIDAKVCNSSGKCISPDKCQCNTGIGGNNCQYFQCYSLDSNNPNVCSGNGKCVSPDKCECNGNFFGSECNLKENYTLLILISFLVIILLIFCWKMIRMTAGNIYDQNDDFQL